jgi:hypothetical protein
MTVIIRHDIVLPEYSDSALRENMKSDQQFTRDRAKLLLCAPPEYRQGIVIYADGQCFTTVDTMEDSIYGSEVYYTGVSTIDALREALDVLAMQGVELRF